MYNCAIKFNGIIASELSESGLQAYFFLSILRPNTKIAQGLLLPFWSQDRDQKSFNYRQLVCRAQATEALFITSMEHATFSSAQMLHPHRSGILVLPQFVRLSVSSNRMLSAQKFAIVRFQ